VSAELHVMFDLETMGMAPNGAIASIGAVRFDPYGDEISDPFYVVVDLKDHCGGSSRKKQRARSLSARTGYRCLTP
jgi:hypothetical protein